AWEPLRDHLVDVANRAASFAASFGPADEARLAGLLHDLGKYSDLFSLRLKGEISGLDHWSAGARAALDRFASRPSPLALPIQGHHIGLQSAMAMSCLGSSLRATPRELKLTDSDTTALLSRFEADGLSLPSLQGPLFDPGHGRAAAMLDVRMLFSTLVDADCL